MLKTGVVVQSNKVFTCVITCEGKFVNLETKIKRAPHIGEIYTSQVYKKGSIFYKLILLSVIILLITYGFINIINKNTPVYSVVVDINSSIQLEVNKTNKILKVQPLNMRGEDLVKDMDLNDKTLDTALTMLLVKADKLKYLEGFYSKKEKAIYIYITNHSNTLVSLPSFKSKADELKITVLINDNGQ